METQQINRYGSSSNKKKLILIVFIYKLLLELSMWKSLSLDYAIYDFSLHWFKYINGLIWSLSCFIMMDLDGKKATSFLLFLVYVIQIIPITAVYGLSEIASPLYYNLLMMSFLLCEFFVYRIKPSSRSFRKSRTVSKAIIPAFALISFALVVILFLQKGLPSLTALNIYKVYDLRVNNPLSVSKYLGYVVTVVAYVFLPIQIVNSAIKKRWLLCAVSMLMLLLIYLYTGNKIFLLSIPLCLAGVFWAKKESCLLSFFSAVMLAISALCLVVSLWRKDGSIFYYAYSLIVRRMMVVPAMLKFNHYDYFTTHPYLALYGALPVAINPYIPHYYETVDYPFEIGAIYYNAPNMSADTGFFAEVFARFGYFGILFGGCLLAAILRGVDSLQKRTNYRTAVCFCLYPIFALTEQSIVGSLFLGVWFFVLLVITQYFEQGQRLCLCTRYRFVFR